MVHTVVEVWGWLCLPCSAARGVPVHAPLQARRAHAALGKQYAVYEVAPDGTLKAVASVGEAAAGAAARMTQEDVQGMVRHAVLLRATRELKAEEVLTYVSEAFRESTLVRFLPISTAVTLDLRDSHVPSSCPLAAPACRQRLGERAPAFD